MAQLQAILNYQEIDRKLFKLEKELAGSEDRKEYVKLKKFLETAMEKLDSLDVKATSLKAEAAELMKSYLKTEELLADFENLDELIAGGADVTFYKKKANSILEQMKKVKADLTRLTATIKETDEEYQKLKKQVIAAQKKYAEAAEKYKEVKSSKETERKQIEGELAAAEKEVPQELMERYKTKRKEKLFPIVGELTGNRCPYCSMEPPLAARSKLTGGATIECDNCHRIIFSKE